MHKKFGKLEFEKLFTTAIYYASEGFPVHEIEAFHWRKNENKLKKNKITKQIFLNHNKAPTFGKKFSNGQLAETLKLIGKKGAKAFYEGEIARDMVKSLNNLGGLHTEEDFYNQNTIFSDTLISNYKDFDIHQCPPNGPGLVVHLMMKLLEKFNWNNIDYIDPMRFHIQAEVTKVCFEIKETILGDPQFKNIDIEYLMSNELVESLFKKINLDKVYNSDKLFVTSHPETIYLTVVDDNLNAVSFINSICHAFGSGICSENSGILFQNRGVNFRLEENHPNCIDSNKRPLHTIIPGLLTNKSNETIISYGVMGGQYQPIGQTHLLQNIYDFDMSMQEAIDAPRAFALNGKLKVENSFSYKSVESLSKLGHEIEIVKEGIGGGQGIMIDRKEGVLIGGSDPRKDGLAIGY
jgi:gamma-glutamyltranspeptidase/glutathione hydrolase